MAVRDAEPVAGTMLRGRGGTAYLEREAVALDRAGIRLVIPLAAIETVFVARNKRPSAEILLNSTVAGAEPATICAISSRNTEAVEAFAYAVNAAIPPRDKAERRIDGAALVKAEQRAFAPMTPRRPFLSAGQWWAWSTLTCLFTLGLLLPVSAGDGRLAQLWAGTFPVLVFGCTIARGTWRATVTWWLLHRYGVTTSARCAGYSPPGDPAHSGTVLYAFTDTSGTSHTFERAGGPSAPDMRIAYDPARPDFARGPRHPWTRILILLIRLLVGVPITLVMVAYLVWYFATAMHARSVDSPGCFQRNW